jgi:sterol 3beta-glucosyltransferase
LVGDVQPYLALSLALVAFGHRVRLATHGAFRDFVHSAGQDKVEFADIGGDPKELLAWMVKSRSSVA